MSLLTVPRSEPRSGSRIEKNRLLAALSEQDYQRLAPEFEVVHLEPHQVLAAPEQPIRYIYFAHDAVVSFLVPMADGRAIEGAVVGNEGIIGLQVFLGDGLASEEVVAAIPGEAVRMRASAFREAVQAVSGLQTWLHRYTQALMNQMARTAGCNRLHAVDQRCARLLLMSRDRVGKDTFPFTHELMATMLGVRRASVTEAAGMLHGAGVIDYHRGTMTVRDRDGLEDFACEDYRLSREGYDRLYS
jgi:CRP-like cAMP-binding protein